MQNPSKEPNPCPVVIVVDDDSGVRKSLKFSLKVEASRFAPMGAPATCWILLIHSNALASSSTRICPA